ncbi:VQ motif-containing protein 20-like [Coffea eugenioides]|uniref:VQ motif-containing protein 20-like n=1 Tax=Coffea arabica TaxID=13443 RepID=A0A6P6XE89_COFAR|nr:VQ motif-containing protein 20-like [Coffea arabica]XP_027155656.1 VQ motif-containing protein 20-like [Coffea eugenioides]
MSPAHFSDQHAKKEMIALSPLKINRDSHFIKKSSPSSSSSSSSSSLVNGVANATNKPAQQRHPVIIYTHSPKVIHTHPKDFMALVQKLTGLSRSSEDDQIISPAPPPPETKVEPNFQDDFTDDNNNKNMMVNDNKGGTMNDDNESTSVVTDEIENNGSSGTTAGDIGQVNSSCFVTPPPIFDPPNPCFNNIPFFNPNPAADFFCTAQPFYNYSDSLFFMPNIRSSLSSATLDGMKELPDF